MRFLRLAAAIVIFSLSATSRAANPIFTLPVAVESPLPEFSAEVLPPGGSGFVEVLMLVDETGRVEKAVSGDSNHPPLEGPVAGATRHWKFIPGTKDGRPASRGCMVRVTFEDGRATVGSVKSNYKLDVMPKLVRSVEPEYPFELNESGNHGSVEVRFVLNTRGEVLAPEVTEATHPAFERAAIAAITQWKFTPAKSKGRPVPAFLVQRVRFTLGPSSVDAFKVNKGSHKDIPEGLRVDKAAEPKVTVSVVHPYESAIQGGGGSAHVKFIVDARGGVAATAVIEASAPEFGMALAAAIEAWRFEPARRGRVATPSVMNRKHTFLVGDRDSAIDSQTNALAQRIRKGRFESVRSQDLDSPLKPTFQSPPVYPRALHERGIAGKATIEVIIDKEGRAVLPRIVEASEPEFGWAAATAAQRWRFDPPKLEGKPVEVRVAIPFTFSVPAAEADEGEPAG